MLGKTHLAAGIAVGAATCLSKGLGLSSGLVCMAGIGLGSLLPDIDQKNSMINKAAKPVGTVVSVVAGHRTIFHDPMLYVVLAVICSFLKPEWMDPYIIPILLGIGSHLFLDMLNPAGIPVGVLFHGPKVHLMRIHTGSKLDALLRIVFTITGRLATIIWLLKILFNFYT